MTKTFAKIAKTFIGLSATIIATRRRSNLILYLEAKYAKMDFKNEIYAKNWVRSTWTAKIELWVKVNGEQSTEADVTKLSTDWMMTSSSDVSKQATRADVADDVNK